MTDLTTNNEDQPHAVFVVLTSGSDMTHVSVGTFPTWPEAATASSQALKETIAMVEDSPMAGMVAVHTKFFPAPVQWQSRVADLLAVFKEEKDDHEAWKASLNKA